MMHTSAGDTGKRHAWLVGTGFPCRPKGPLDTPERIGGPALEGLVAQHLRAWNAYRQGSAELFFWRTQSGSEVDFVLYGPDTFRAIEVKSGTQIHPQTLKGLNAFKSDYPEAELFLVYGGSERLRNGAVPCLPIDAFLKGLEPHRPIGQDALWRFCLVASH